MKINYLNNKDILKEIHKSKTSYCCFTKPEFSNYDMILPDVQSIDKKNIVLARKNRAERLAKEGLVTAIEKMVPGQDKPKLEEFLAKHTDILETDVVFRIMTWDHVPKGNILKKQVIDEDSPHTEYDETDPVNMKYLKVNFPPFQHWMIDDSGKLVCVGKSHWIGTLDSGEFSKDHGKMTNKLAHMFIKLCERYATRSNWRGYCVDTQTEALTTRGWLGIDQITENDTILSYSKDALKWSAIKSIYRGKYDGLMHHITSRSIDALVTPNHKLVTSRGLVPAELVKQSDQVIIMGDAVDAPTEKTYSDSFVELTGWIMTEGCYEYGSDKKIKRICIYQNPTVKADRIRQCLIDENYTFTEGGDTNLCFAIWKEYAKKFTDVFKTKNLTMDFILSLTADQRELLINTMVDGDGWRRKGDNMSYCQKDKEHVDLFQALLTLTGKKSNSHYVVDHPSFGKLVNYYSINVFSKRGNKTRGECLNFNGGLNNGEGTNRGLGKNAFPNSPTVPYNDMVWCPETEYGSFVARRNGKVYLTGNTYNDEMRSQALLQLSQIGLQFDENKSNNPFAYYTAVITNSFTRVLNIEKRNQNIRDDILEQNNMNPSYTRQFSNSGGAAPHDE